MPDSTARVGWFAVDARTVRGHPAPASGWNGAASLTAGAWRIPLEALSVDCGRDGAHARTRELARGAASPAGRGRAVVVAPEAPAGAVDVLLFFHGNNIGWRRRAEGEAPRDVARDRLGAQLATLRASGLPVVAVLPQGTVDRGSALSRFGPLDADAYIAEALAAASAHPGAAWLAGAAVGRVVAGGHSGGGIDLSHLLLGRAGMRAPARLGGVIHFDAINFRGAEPADHWRWSAALLGEQLATLRGLDPDAQGRYLDTSCGLAAFYTLGSSGPDGYGRLYDAHRRAFDRWFVERAAELDASVPRAVQDRWRARFRFERVATSHDVLVGANDGVVRGVRALLTGAR
jgi:hypothetical protein